MGTKAEEWHVNTLQSHKLERTQLKTLEKKNKEEVNRPLVLKKIELMCIQCDAIWGRQSHLWRIFVKKKKKEPEFNQDSSS